MRMQAAAAGALSIARAGWAFSSLAVAHHQARCSRADAIHFGVSRSFLSLINLSSIIYQLVISGVASSRFTRCIYAIPTTVRMCGNLDDAALEIKGLSYHISQLAQLPHLPAGNSLLLFICTWYVLCQDRCMMYVCCLLVIYAHTLEWRVCMFFRFLFFSSCARNYATHQLFIECSQIFGQTEMVRF
jgi:hypothetical protein